MSIDDVIQRDAELIQAFNQEALRRMAEDPVDLDLEEELNSILSELDEGAREG